MATIIHPFGSNLHLTNNDTDVRLQSIVAQAGGNAPLILASHIAQQAINTLPLTACPPLATLIEFNGKQVHSLLNFCSQLKDITSEHLVTCNAQGKVTKEESSSGTSPSPSTETIDHLNRQIYSMTSTLKKVMTAIKGIDETERKTGSHLPLTQEVDRALLHVQKLIHCIRCALNGPNTTAATSAQRLALRSIFPESTATNEPITLQKVSHLITSLEEFLSTYEDPDTRAGCIISESALEDLNSQEELLVENAKSTIQELIQQNRDNIPLIIHLVSLAKFVLTPSLTQATDALTSRRESPLLGKALQLLEWDLPQYASLRPNHLANFNSRGELVLTAAAVDRVIPSIWGAGFLSGAAQVVISTVKGHNPADHLAIPMNLSFTEALAELDPVCRALREIGTHPSLLNATPRVLFHLASIKLKHLHSLMGAASSGIDNLITTYESNPGLIAAKELFVELSTQVETTQREIQSLLGEPDTSDLSDFDDCDTEQ